MGQYIVPKGYPVNPMKGETVDISDVDQDKVKVFYASVEEEGGQLVMGGSRAIGFVGIDKDIFEAERKVETEIMKVVGAVAHREDIGTKKLIEQRVKMQQEVRENNF